MSWLNSVLQRGRRHIFVPMDQLDLVQQDKGGYKVNISPYFRRAKFQARRANPIVQNMNDYVQWMFYDRAVFGAGTNVPVNFKLFTVPINGTFNGVTKTKVDTNLDQGQRINDPGWMNAVGLGFYFGGATIGAPTSPALLADVEGFIESAVMEFWVGNKVYLEGPYQCFPAGAGLTGFGNIAAQQVVTNGIPRIGNMFDMRLPSGMHLGNDSGGNAVISDGLLGVTILQTQLLKVENSLPGGVLALTAAGGTFGAGLKVAAYLVGTYSRGVQ